MNERSICYNCFCERTETVGACPNCGYDPDWDAQKYPLALPHGHILCDKYILGRVLGQGGYGITYLALDKWLGIKVAVKEYFPEVGATRTSHTSYVAASSIQKQEEYQKGKEDFLQEARTLAAFTNNPNIVRIHGYFEENNTAYFAMDYVAGISLQKYIQNQGGKIPWEDAYEKLFPIITALEEVHKKDIIHRDIAVDNIYISSDGTIKLLDFGAARYQSLNQSHSLDVVLKHGYAPFEQYNRRGKQGPFTDVYAICACFYAAVTGILPPDAPERIEEDRIVSFAGMSVSVPQSVETVIFKGLEVKSKDRYQNMTELRTALEQAINGSVSMPSIADSKRTATDIQPPPIAESKRTATDIQPPPIADSMRTAKDTPLTPQMKEKFPKNGKKKWFALALGLAIIAIALRWGYSLTHDHVYGEWVITKEPTCTEEGIKKRRCSCWAVEKEVLPKHTIHILPAVKPTCEESGLTEGEKCIVCGYEKKKQEEVKALGHEKVIDAKVEATCTENGKTKGSHCSKCGKVITKQKTIKAKGHKFAVNTCKVCGIKHWWAEVSTAKNTYSRYEYTEFHFTVYTNEKNAKTKIKYEVYRDGSLRTTGSFEEKWENGYGGRIYWENGVRGSEKTIEIYFYNHLDYCIGYHSINIVD